MSRIAHSCEQQLKIAADAKKILIISFSNISSDPRVMRQVRLLESRFEVTVAGFGPKPDADVEFCSIHHESTRLPTKMWWALKLLLGLSESYYWNRVEIQSAFAMLRGREFDLVISNDIAALPLAIRLAQEGTVLLDAHEYSPREFDDKWAWRLLFGRYHHELCQRYLPRLGGMVTVCQGIADEYAREYGVASEVVHNAPPHQKLRPSRTAHGRIRMVHHGATIRSRRLEGMIDVMMYLDDRFTLDFMLMENDPGYLKELRARAASDSRIRFLQPVPMTEICQALNDYDMGIFLLPPVNFNYAHALPNKFFEFIQARLAVAIGPSREMANITKKYGIGVVAKSFNPADLGVALSRMSEADLVRYKLAADIAAESLNDKPGSQVLLRMVERQLAQ